MSADSRDGSGARVVLFGGPGLEIGGHAVDLSPYQACLLGLVFGSDAPVRRERLVHLLWEESGPEARHRLSQLLYSFTRRPGGTNVFEADRERVAPGTPAHAADLRHFGALVERQELGRAADLLQRGFLSGLVKVPTRAYQEWLDGRRASLRAAVRNPAARLWSRHSAEEAWPAAARAASVLLRLDPLDERALRNVLWSRGMAGRVQAALAEYHNFCERKEAEDPDEPWEPSGETEELVERLRSLRTPPLPPPEFGERAADPEPELCGRDRELAALSRLVASPGESPLTTVVVTGEGGIGKTRLVEEVLRGARLRGFRVLRAGSSEFERDIPLNPLLEALDEPQVGLALDRLDDPWRSVLLSLMPQLHRSDGPLPEVPYVEPESLPRRTYEALRRLIVAAVSENPVVLFLDDFQWADDTSVAAVEFLRRRWPGGRLVLILALRLEGFTRRSRSEEFAEELVGQGNVVHLALDELDAASAEDLVAEVGSSDIAPEIRRQISVLAGRNPFFTVELTHEYLEGRVAPHPDPGEVLPVPMSIRQLLDRRLEELSAAARQVLETLATYGHVTPAVALPELTGHGREQSVTALERLQRLRLVRWEEEGVRVRHELIRHTVYGRLSSPRRELLHERVARWLLRSPDPTPDELALHFDRAGLSEEALTYALKAADRAQASGAVPEAVYFLRTARRNTDDPEIAAEVVGRMGHLHYLHRNFEEAAPLLEVAADRYRSQGRTAPALQAETERLDALSRLDLLPLQDFLERGDRIKREARERDDWDTVAKLLDIQVHTLDRAGQVDRVRLILDEAEEVADRGSAAARCAAKSTLALNLFYGSPERALSAAREAVALAQEENLDDALLRACNRLIMVLTQQGRLRTAEGHEIIQIAECLSEQTGDLHLRFGTPLNQGVWHLDIGDLRSARNFFARAEKIIRAQPNPELVVKLQLNLAELAFVEGNITTASEIYQKCSNREEVGTAFYASVIAKSGLGLCAIERGDFAFAQHIEETLPPEQDEWIYDQFLMTLFRSRLLRRQSRKREALEVLDTASGKIKGRFVPSWLKLKLEEARLAKSFDKHHASQVAAEAAEVAEKLRLSTRLAQFKNIIQ